VHGENLTLIISRVCGQLIVCFSNKHMFIIILTSRLHNMISFLLIRLLPWFLVYLKIGHYGRLPILTLSCCLTFPHWLIHNLLLTFDVVQTVLNNNNRVGSFFFLFICQLFMYSYCCLLTVLIGAMCNRLAAINNQQVV
jgi:hypothetical protein